VFRHFGGLLCAALLSGATAHGARAATMPDLSGVWMNDDAPTALRLTDGAAVPLTDWGLKQYESNQAMRV
jgi:hypothetical protein